MQVDSGSKAMVGELTGQLTRRSVLRGFGAMLAIGSVGVLTSCAVPAGSGGGGGDAPRKRVALLLPSYTQARWKAADQPFFEQEAEKLGLDVVVQAANDDVALQSTQVDQVLTQGVDVIVLVPVNVDSSADLVAKAKAQNVPVVAYNYVFDAAGVEVIVSRDAVKVGRDMAMAALAAAPTGNYTLASGDQGTSVSRDKAAGTMEVLQPHIDSGAITIVSDRFNKDWSADLALKQVEGALTANNNDIAAVIVQNDNMGYGVIQALTAQQVAGKVVVTSEDAEPNGQKLIASGEMTASSFTPFSEMAAAAARAAADLAAGKAVSGAKTIDAGSREVPWVEIEAFNVDKNNLAQFQSDYPWWTEA